MARTKAKTPKTPCKTHRWQTWGHRGMTGTKGKTFVCERCRRCEEQRERPATEAERQDIRKKYLMDERRTKLMHRAWRPVQKLLKEYGNVCSQEEKGKLSTAIDRLMEKYPDLIRYVRCDDDSHCGSDLYFISHKYDDPKAGKGYWGTSVVYIGQCSYDPPARFFLYPGHARGLRDLTELLDKEARTLNRGKRLGQL